MNNDTKVKLCQDDFYLMMCNAVLQSGGSDRLEEWKKMKLEDLVNRFAQSGIRMVYMPEKHMDSIKIVWQDLKTNAAADLTASAYSKIPFTPPNQPYIKQKDDSLPKKKQLLCDQFGEPMGEENENPSGVGGFY
jgi:hypothetical protein